MVIFKEPNLMGVPDKDREVNLLNEFGDGVHLIFDYNIEDYVLLVISDNDDSNVLFIEPDNSVDYNNKCFRRFYLNHKYIRKLKPEELIVDKYQDKNE